MSTPLTKKPPTGKKVIFLVCQLPSCARYQAGAKTAAAALGWNITFQTLSNSAPAASLSQAVAQKPDYIFLSGIPQAVLKAPLAAAAAAHIPVISAADPEKPSAGGFATQIGGTLVPDAENVTRWMINDSGGKANVVAVSIPQFPVLVGETTWMKSNLTSLCSGCHYDELDVTVADVGAGKVASILTGYLQAHPNTNYVFFTFSDLGKTVPPVLKASGFGKVKLTGCCGDSGIGQQISTGKQNAWTISPNVYSGYEALDAMSRLSVGMSLAGAYSDAIYPSPSWVVDSAASANQYLKPTAFDWPGPSGFQAQFQKLEHVG